MPTTDQLAAKKEERKKSHSALIWPGSSPLANQSLMRMPLALLYLPMLPLRSLASACEGSTFVPPPHEAGCGLRWKSPGPEKLIKFRPLAFQVTGTHGGKPHPLHKRDLHGALNDGPWWGWLGFCLPCCQLLTLGTVSPPLHKLNWLARPRAASGAGRSRKHVGHHPLSPIDMQMPESAENPQTREGSDGGLISLKSYSLWFFFKKTYAKS